MKTALGAAAAALAFAAASGAATETPLRRKLRPRPHSGYRPRLIIPKCGRCREKPPLL